MRSQPAVPPGEHPQFLAVSALRTEERGQAVFDWVFRVLGQRGHRLLPKSRSNRATGDNQIGFDTAALDWLTILYPAGFLDGFGCTQALSEAFGCLAFDFEVYAGEAWWDNLFDNGRLVDVFWQQPRYFEGRHPTESRVGDAALRIRRGQPALVAELAAVPAALIEPYYEQLDDGPFRRLRTHNPAAYRAQLGALRQARTRLAHEGDAYPLHSPMSFVDFAAKLGIHYPASLISHADLVFFGLQPAVPTAPPA